MWIQILLISLDILIGNKVYIIIIIIINFAPASGLLQHLIEWNSQHCILAHYSMSSRLESLVIAICNEYTKVTLSCDNSNRI